MKINLTEARIQVRNKEREREIKCDLACSLKSEGGREGRDGKISFLLSSLFPLVFALEVSSRKETV